MNDIKALIGVMIAFTVALFWFAHEASQPMACDDTVSRNDIRICQTACVEFGGLQSVYVGGDCMCLDGNKHYVGEDG